MASPLDLFHPLVRTWFTERLGVPTGVQRRTWPEIAAGRHVLATAPTGSGKTLAAFLWAIDRLLTGELPAGAVRVLYVSPLKALNTDVSRNLERPLAELSARFRAAGVEAPAIRAAVRSGDTPQSERQKMLRRPPEILITTPESLNILLTSAGGRSLLSGVSTVILDEIHAVAGSKRGTHLATAIERLALLAGEHQRIALSATVKPLSTIAAFVGGRELVGGAGGATYRERPVSIVRSDDEKRYEFAVRFPEEGLPGPDSDASVWDLLVPEIRAVIERHQSTLVFANSRRLTEKLTRLVNAEAEADLAYSHHGSLSREVRAVVEERLKRGELPAIVATNTLELGIDIGAIDEVVMVQSPRTFASAVQRVGRSGHGVGEVSRGTLFPLYGRDFVDAAVIARAVMEGEVEAIDVVERPLDVLAQVILSMTVADEWPVDDLYDFVRTAYPYRDLSRRHFDLVLDMLAGRYADSRLRELAPRVSLDRLSNTVKARPGAARLLYSSGGTIPDRGYYHLRIEGTGDEPSARLGELDEEFVWERSPGDTFTLGTQVWRIRRITHNDVFVEPARASSAMAPFWRADDRDRSFTYSERVGRFLEEAERRLDEPAFRAELAELYRMDEGAAAELVSLLSRQRDAFGGRLPHRRRVVVEEVGESGAGGLDKGRPEGVDRRRIVVHTFWGGRVNRPFAVALAAAWQERHGTSLEVYHDDDCLMMVVPAELAVEAADPFALVHPDRLEELLRERLEATGFFGARFRENASRALLLPKASFRNRTPLWLNRQRAKRLLEAVRRYGDFPLMIETWRTCLEDEFDLDVLKRLLGEITEGEIALERKATATASPFAANLIWRETNRLMYETDAPEAGAAGGAPASGLRRDLLRELVFSSRLRPRLPGSVVEEFRRKVQRVAEGYAPRDADDLLDWLKERVLVPDDEWRELLAAIGRDREQAEDDLLAGLAGRAVWIRPPAPAAPSEPATLPAVVAVESLPRIAAALGVDVAALAPRALAGGEGGAPPPGLDAALERLRAHAAPAVDPDGPAAADPAAAQEEAPDPLAELLAEWLRYYGPLPEERLETVFGVGPGRLTLAVEELVESERAVADELTAGAAATEICDSANLEVLLRWTRKAARPTFTALPVERLPHFLALHQGVVPRGGTLDDLQARLEALFLYPAPAGLWEEEVLPARLDPYRTAWLDTLMRETDLVWSGAGEGRIAFAFPADLDLLVDERADLAGEAVPADATDPADPIGELFPDRRGRFPLDELAAAAGRPRAAVWEEMWRLAWEGRVTNDSFQAIRRGVLGKFRPPEGAERPRREERPGRPVRPARRWAGRGGDRWRPDRSLPGHWYPLPHAAAAADGDVPPLDALEREELAKERARVILERYGVVFRELLAREAPVFAWSRLFRALRLMELAGEVLAGQFFTGVPGLQFASRPAFRRLSEELWDEDRIYWLNAADPASLAGVDLPGLKGDLPARRPSSHLVYHGPRLVVVGERSGRRLRIDAPPEHPRLADYLDFLAVLLTRDFHPKKVIKVEEINGERPVESPYAEVLRSRFSATGEAEGGLALRRRW